MKFFALKNIEKQNKNYLRAKIENLNKKQWRYVRGRMSYQYQNMTLIH